MKTVEGLILLSVCVVSLALVGCKKQSAARVKPTDVGATYVAPAGTGARSIDGVEYEYVATAERESQIIGGFPMLRVGQTREEVRAALGFPDRAQPMYGKAYAAPFHGWSYKYNIKMQVGGPNGNDVLVQVFFDPSHKLKWAVPNHIAGLTEIGSPSRP